MSSNGSNHHLQTTTEFRGRRISTRLINNQPLLVNPSTHINPHVFDQIEIAGFIMASVKECGPLSAIIKGRENVIRARKKIKKEHLLEIFRFYCNEMQVVPVKFLNYFNNGTLELVNYNIHANLCIAIACTIPV